MSANRKNKPTDLNWIESLPNELQEFATDYPHDLESLIRGTSGIACHIRALLPKETGTCNCWVTSLALACELLMGEAWRDFDRNFLDDSAELAMLGMAELQTQMLEGTHEHGSFPAAIGLLQRAGFLDDDFDVIV